MAVSDGGPARSLWARLCGPAQLQVRSFAAPADTRLYAVGDIHGRRDLLDAMHGLIGADAAGSRASRKVLIYLGDYVDRGPDSRGVLDAVARSLPGFDTVRLLGNHEREMIAVLDGERDGRHWLGFGGVATLQSYGVALAEIQANLDDLRHLLKQVVPPEHQDLLHRLQILHREGDLCFVHAGIRPGVALEAQDPEDLVWIREPFLRSEVEHGCLVIHGHTIVRKPELRANRIGIDTGAYATGRLTCLVVEGDALSFLNT